MIAVSNALANLGYTTGAYQGFTYDSESTKGILKLDWNINDKHRAAIIYNFLRASKEKPAHPTALGIRGLVLLHYSLKILAMRLIII